MEKERKRKEMEKKNWRENEETRSENKIVRIRKKDQYLVSIVGK